MRGRFLDEAWAWRVSCSRLAFLAGGLTVFPGRLGGPGQCGDAARHESWTGGCDRIRPSPPARGNHLPPVLARHRHQVDLIVPMDQAALSVLLTQLISGWESEVVEFKRGNGGFSGNKLGKYVSALANEANLHGRERAWLVFGVDDKTRSVVGTDGVSVTGPPRERHAPNRNLGVDSGGKPGERCSADAVR